MTHTLTSLLELSRTADGLETIRVMVAELNAITPARIDPGSISDARQGWRCPDYPRSLDAMHECEKGLTDEEHDSFLVWLILVCEGKRTISASALPRAIAYILTKQPTKGDDRE